MDKLNIVGAPWIMILGPKGAGKTRLAATLPQNLCLDTEPPGAASAFPNEYRVPFIANENQYTEVTQYVARLSSGFKKVERAIEWEGKTISAITIDTFDTLQKFLIARYLSQMPRPKWIKPDQIWAPRMERQDWGTMLNFQSLLIANLKKLPIPVIWTAHSKQYDPLYEGRGENYHCKQRGKLIPDVSGSIEDWITNLCDYILTITINEEGVRRVYTQPTVVDDVVITAADRHRLFKNDKQDLTSFVLTLGEDGFPVTSKGNKPIEYIVSNHIY